MYHYTECGLNNVWLKNGYTTIETPYGIGTSIDDVDGLHRSIALGLIKKKGNIDGSELRFLRVILKLTQSELGKLLGTTDQTVSLWERNNSITPSADVVIRLLVAEKLKVDSKPSHIAAVVNAVQAIKEIIIAIERKKNWGAILKKETDLSLAV